MSGTLNHPSEERLHGFVEESLDAAERAVVASHLTACEPCRVQVDELRALFGVLHELPALDPSPAFEDRVMARVRVRRPVLSRVKDGVSDWAGALEKLAPQTTRGWAAASGVFALPVLALTALTWWLLSQPGVTPQTLWMIASTLAGDAMATSWQWASARLAQSTPAGYLAHAMELLDSVGRGELGLALVMLATATAASIYVLYQNLFRTNGRRTDHASYVF